MFVVPAIERIHWGHVGIRYCSDEPGSLFAVWPEPVDRDVCFEKAGFDRFADSDQTWDADLESVLQGVLTTLGKYGEPVVNGDPPAWRQSLKDRVLGKRAPDLRLSEQVALVAHDDQFAPCRVDFGLPIRAAIFVSDGHPIVWIWLHHDVAPAWQDHLKALADARDVTATTLHWNHLLPASLPFSVGA